MLLCLGEWDGAVVHWLRCWCFWGLRQLGLDGWWRWLVRKWRVDHLLGGSCFWAHSKAVYWRVAQVVHVGLGAVTWRHVHPHVLLSLLLLLLLDLERVRKADIWPIRIVTDWHLLHAIVASVAELGVLLLIPVVDLLSLRCAVVIGLLVHWRHWCL